MAELDRGRMADLTELDRLIHQPARLAIMSLLYVVEKADFTFVLNQLDLTWGNLSSHLSKLEEAGYVAVEKEFVDKKPQSTCWLTEQGRHAFDGYRRQIQAAMEALPPKK
jgi:DNA-binding transcriptional ArsR family regulator